jgi:hypothetical protein
MSDQQADNGGVTSYKFHADQCTETATKNECRFAGKRTDQPRCVIGMRRDLVSLSPDWRATGQSAAVVRDDSKIAAKLIGQGFRKPSALPAPPWRINNIGPEPRIV